MRGADPGPRASRADGVELTPGRSTPDGSISARARVTPESFWFKGHFPAGPILPGIALVGLVFETLQSVSERPLRLAGLRRVRFRRAVGPGDRMEIAVASPRGAGLGVDFKVFVDNIVVCSGTLDVL